MLSGQVRGDVMMQLGDSAEADASQVGARPCRDGEWHVKGARVEIVLDDGVPREALLFEQLLEGRKV